MRNAFAKELTALGEQDERIVLLSGDIGNRMFDDFKSRCPGRFFNCGIAEGNMMSMAAGLAMSGMRPVVYTIVPFVTTRCLEQIRVDVCYHRVPVIIVGVGGGLAYASLGATHHSCEDIGFLRLLPNMTVVCPADSAETRGAFRAALECEHGVYIRLGKKGEPDVHRQDPTFKLGKAILMRDGRDVTLISTGNMLPTTIEAADLLAASSVSARVISMHTVKPLDEETLAEAFASTSLVVTIEEHSVIGGLGGAVAEWQSEHTSGGGRLLRIGTPDHFLHEAGNQRHARRVLHLDAESIAARILQSSRHAPP
ncbi:MAG: transketolase [Planctomycetota bacterium]|nr:transketolase [Planctomycetota bacterium]